MFQNARSTPPHARPGRPTQPGKPLHVPRTARHDRRGPALGGACLTICTDLCQTRGFVGLPTRSSVHAAKALRSWIELAIAHPTTSADLKSDIVTSLQVRISAATLTFAVQAYAEPRRDGVTAAFRSKTRRLLVLPHAWRSRAPHFRARRPLWSIALS